jgi:hypothetical protein
MLSTLKTMVASVRESRVKSQPWTQNENYVHEAPSVQQTLDIFEGAWSSVLPFENVAAGASRLFDDDRIKWMLDQLGDVAGWDVLELGPLEGGHSFMLEQAGARHIEAVDANKTAYLKCLVIKELLGLKAAHFVLGDFDEVLRSSQKRYDLIVASGVLYHMADPLVTLQNMTRLSDRIFIWSHFFDEVAMPANDPRRRPITGEVTKRTVEGDTLTYHSRSYLNNQGESKFCGGSQSKSVWLEREETIALLRNKGYDVTSAFDEPDHQNGPSVCLLAQKRVVLD